MKRSTPGIEKHEKPQQTTRNLNTESLLQLDKIKKFV